MSGMNNEWHSRYTIPDRADEHILIEVELITGKTALYYTSGYGISTSKASHTTIGWMWVDRWRYVFNEEDVKDSGL